MSQKPVLVVNHTGRKQKVLTTILEELNSCNYFEISVAFITQSGVACILETLSRLEKKGVHGRILTSQYLNFTQPHALDTLIGFSNIEVRMEITKDFHSKGYLFQKSNSEYAIYLGSSNLTNTALTTNVELNVGLEILDDADVFLTQYRSDFSEYWSGAVPVDKEFINQYSEVYQAAKNHKGKMELELLGMTDTESPLYQKISPNKMQQVALRNLEQLRSNGQKKALLISATGTGKTYLSAFDVARVNPARVLFVVHRRTIAEKSMQTFRSLMPQRTMALYSGSQRGEAEFLFATVQTITRDVSANRFAPDTFDYVIIDETHRADASSYKRILEHLEPDFLLGMTATPERTDGGDVFKLFDHNIAYEIRLNQALEENMLVPFHYFGVSDLTINGDLIDDHSDFNLLVSDERVKHIIEKASLYKSDSGRTKGLIFCSRKSEAKELATKLELYGFRIIALTGDSNEDSRRRAIEELEAGALDYIITVNIFNEGVDIPAVNQVIMLRPTQSAIIFVQQLGRGLRKAPNKEYLTVIDFIGNYANSYLIPIALYGDNSYNKDNIRKLLVGGSQGLPGACTIDFDEISQKQIFDSIDNANLSRKKDLKADYETVMKIIGRKPMMIDFLEHGSRDPFQYVGYSGSIYGFARAINMEINELSWLEEEVLCAVAKCVNDGKRLLDSLLLSILIKENSVSISVVQDRFEKITGVAPSQKELENSMHCMNLNFDIVRYQNQDVRISEKLKVKLVQLDQGRIERTIQFTTLLSNQTFKEYLVDSTNYGIFKSEERIREEGLTNGGFTLYKKYTRRDVLRLLGWDKNRNATTIGGYRMSPDKSNCPIFVTYHKADDIEGSIAYEDEFISPSRFKWMSRSNRRLESDELQPLINSSLNGLRLPLFVKKDDNEGIDFYYLGEVQPIADSVEQQYMPDDSGKQLPVVKFEFTIDPPVEPGLYKYLNG